MANGVPRDHHYVPQFYLREFACESEKTKIRTISRNGEFAIYAERSIKNLGYERDFYVHSRGGVPVSVEPLINRDVETPISRSDTWSKICLNRGDQLDRKDKVTIYSLIRHLHSRNVHAQKINERLAIMAADPNSEIPFTEEERKMYAHFRRRPDDFRRFFNYKASSLGWSARDYQGAGISIFRSPIPLRTSTTPVMVLSAPPHPALRLPLPGQIPFQYVLVLNRFTVAILVLADFDDAFSNQEMPLDAAKMFNRHYVGYFSHFGHIRHLIADDDALVDDMVWAPYDLLYHKDGHMKFQRRPGSKPDSAW